MELIWQDLDSECGRYRFLKWFLPLKIQVNSEKPGFGKKKSVENVVTLWADGTSHSSAPLKNHFIGHRVWGALCPNPNDIVGVFKPCLILPLQPDFIYLFIAQWTLAIVAVIVNWHVYYLHQYHKSVVEKACYVWLHTPMWEWYLKHSIVCKI
jgi:hypothetical protein